MLNIVLHEPEIPLNTGNIGRTCVATGASLHLIEPIGFKITAKEIKRSGLDYWDRLELYRYSSFEDFQRKNQGAKIWMATTKAQRLYWDVEYSEGDYIMLGKESAGIPEYIRQEYSDYNIKIPMLEGNRSLNLANSAAIILYEAIRQVNNGFVSI